MPLPTCPYCGAEAALVPGTAVYPDRPDLALCRFWRCAPCGAWVGCHPGSDRPLGSLADAGTRQARLRAHEAFDPLWRGKQPGARRKAYAWLAPALGIEPHACHISLFDAGQCGEVVRVCAARTETEVVVWA